MTVLITDTKICTRIASAVSEREYQRLLKLPRNYTMEGDMLERAKHARAWYGENGQPYVASSRVEVQKIQLPSVILTTGHELRSDVLAKRFLAGEAHALMVVAVSAGKEVALEVSRHWTEGRPDEAFFLDRFAVAVVERLVFNAAGLLCRSLERTHETLMQHLSPGCGHWDLSDQHKLMELLTGTEGGTTLGPLNLLDSGAIEPQHSILAVMGITHRNFAYSPEDLCRSCDLKPCEFRRAPFGGEAFQSLETR